jgi:uncharacterized repeat protein (TIGR03803 family)
MGIPKVAKEIVMIIRPSCTFRTSLLAPALTMLGLLTMLATSGLAQTFSVLHAFSGGADGQSPNGVTVAGPGVLYGTTFEGGMYGGGVAFKLTQRGSAWTLNPLWEFTGGSDGASPFASVTVGPNGALYGTTFLGGTGNCTSGGCGTVYEVQPPATTCKTAICYWNETVLHSFQAEANDGQFPESVIPAFDHAGNLYGTTQDGGAYGAGILWELSPSAGGWTESVPHSFQNNGIDGWQPKFGVILDPAGNLYGTTWYGGTLEGGTVYELSPSGGTWTENILYNFPLTSTGYSAYPEGLVMDPSGNLYGTLTESGVANASVLELTPSDGSWNLSTLYIFSNRSCYPGSIARDAAGNLYGSCNEGGAYGYGWVFKLTNSGGSWTLTDLYDFTGQSDGGYPAGAVVLDSSGNLYGGTAMGGNLSDCIEYNSVGCGTVWEITP